MGKSVPGQESKGTDGIIVPTLTQFHRGME